MAWRSVHKRLNLRTNNTRGISPDIRIGGQTLETVKRFKYLGLVMTDEGSKREIWSRIAQKVGALSKLKTMERQEHCLQLQNQNDAFLGHFNLLVRLQNMDHHSRGREKDTSYRNEMLLKTSGYLLEGSCYE